MFLTRCYCIPCAICTGKPSRSSDDPDFVPTVFEYTKRTNAGCKNDIQVEEADDILEVPVEQMISSKYYTINGTRIISQDHCKDLGVIFASDLSWTEHYHSTCISAKAYQILGLIR